MYYVYSLKCKDGYYIGCTDNLKDRLARKSDVAYTTLTKIETGIIKSPSVFVVEKIAEALGVDIEELIK